MTQRKRNRSRSRKDDGLMDDDSRWLDEASLRPETKRGIIGVILVALAALSILSLFELAGSLGMYLAVVLSTLFGITKWIVPVLFLIASYFLLARDDESPRSWTGYLGILLLILTLNSMIHLVASEKGTQWTAGELTQTGGYLGLALSLPLVSFAGEAASFVILAALLIISLLILLNTSFKQLSQKSFFWIAWIAKLKKWKSIFQEEQTYYEGKLQEDEEAPEKNDRESSIDDSSLGEKIFEKRSFRDPSVFSGGENIKALVTKRRRKKVDLPFDLLLSQSTKPTSGDIKSNAQKIKKAFENFSIDVELGEVNIGPTVTQYAIKPADGVKLSRIRALNDDLALVLAAHPIRIEAPIPGKSLVGIEVPNQVAATVTLKEMLLSKDFAKRESSLTMALGKDVSGMPWFTDISKMPHLLIAGATGSGKTICINSMILSLLYQNGPDHLKFIMVDPKRVELPAYNGIPHLISPVIIDVKKTINALKWCIGEMDRRFEVLSKSRRKDIASYNETSEDQMPYLLVIIDELADLMAAASHEVESAIIRLSQMARAVGIHLILATQRPSVDVITGLIKANITSRIAFSVASIMDSRTILDTSGADKLLGRGDMLFLSSQMSKPKRLQGAFVSEAEIRSVVEYIKEAHEAPEYDETIVESHALGSFLPSGEGIDDALYEEAKRMVIESKKASASLLQRRLKIGYARAARILDILEENGIVGPPDGAKPREIFVDQFQEDATMDGDVEEEEQ